MEQVHISMVPRHKCRPRGAKLVSVVSLTLLIMFTVVAATLVLVAGFSPSCDGECKYSILAICILFGGFALLSLLAFVFTRFETCSHKPQATVYLKNIDGFDPSATSVRDRFLERVVASTGDSRNADPRRAVKFLTQKATEVDNLERVALALDEHIRRVREERIQYAEAFLGAVERHAPLQTQTFLAKPQQASGSAEEDGVVILEEDSDL